jgi:hypothetical protein
MNMHGTAILLLLLGVMLWQQPAQAQRAATQRILIDGSASMTGFHSTDQLRKLNSAISSQIGAGAQSYYFINDEPLKPFDPNQRPYGSRTRLRHALSEALNSNPTPEIIWFVTDNQPSVGNSDSDKDLDGFYNLLLSPRVKRIQLFPLKLKFKGAIYTEDDKTLEAEYAGLRGLLVYALLIDERAKSVFESTVTALKGRLDSDFSREQVGSIFIKPPEEARVKVLLRPGGRGTDNVRPLRVVNKGIFGDGFAENEPIKGRFKIVLEPESDQLQINEADVDVSPTGEFQTSDFLETAWNVRATERKIKNLNPQNRQEFDVILSMDPVRIRQDFTTYWKSIFLRHGDIKGNILISIKVSGKNNFSPAPSLMEFSTDKNIYRDKSEKTQSKIYSLDTLVRRMLPQEGEITIRPRVEGSPSGVIPAHLRIKAPKGAAWALIALILLSLLLIGAVVWRIRRQPIYRLTWDNNRYRACHDFHLWPWSSQTIAVDDRKVAVIRNSLGGIKVSAARGFLVDGLAKKAISPFGSDFNVTDRNDGFGMDFYFSKAGLVKQRRAGSGLDDFYADGFDRKGGSGLEQEAAPVRKPTTGGKYPGATASEPSKTSGDSPTDINSLFR